MAGLGGGSNKWVKCLPAKWSQEDKEVQEQTYLNKKFGGISSTGRSILKFIDLIIEGICRYKSAVMKIFEIIFTGNKGRFFLEGRYGTRKMTTRGFFKKLMRKARSVANRIVKNVKKGVSTVARHVKRAANTVAKGVKRAANTVAKGVQNAAKFVADKVKQAWNAVSLFTRGIITKIQGFFVELKDSIFGFFRSETFKFLVKMFTCIPTLRDATMQLKQIFIGLKTKMTMLYSGVFTVPAIVKFIFALICKRHDFIAAINDFGAASSSHDTLQKFYLNGRGVGRIIQAVATARR